MNPCLLCGLDVCFGVVEEYAAVRGEGEFLDQVEWDDLNRFDYGLSLGAGLEIWKLQISGKYSWSFGKLADNGSIHIDSDNWKLDDANMRGFELSVAFLF